MEIGFSSHVLFTIERHAANAYPREAYGFCLGVTDLALVFVALPVGETIRRGGSADRFGDLGPAFPPASKLASSFNMHILALYHAHSDAIAASPLAWIPEQFIGKPILVQEVGEGDLRREPCYYVKHPSKGWREVEATKVARKILRGESNPRLVSSKWKILWGK